LGRELETLIKDVLSEFILPSTCISTRTYGIDTHSNNSGGAKFHVLKVMFEMCQRRKAEMREASEENFDPHSSWMARRCGKIERKTSFL
jgi:hypothetical protein